jgi:hypothetical protein
MTIEHLTPSSENYAPAWDLLVDRYENKRLIIQHHIRAIYSINPTNHKDYKGLRQMLHTFTSNIEALKSMGRPTHSWDDLLIQLISSKFDVNTTTAWESILTKEPPTVKELTTFLTQRCQTLESIEVNSFSKSANQKSSRSQQNAYANTTGNPVKCVMCNKNHNLYQCQKFLSLSVAQRQNTVKQHK